MSDILFKIEKFHNLTLAFELVSEAEKITQPWPEV